MNKFIEKIMYYIPCFLTGEFALTSYDDNNHDLTKNYLVMFNKRLFIVSGIYDEVKDKDAYVEMTMLVWGKYCLWKKFNIKSFRYVSQNKSF